jgi:PilZ domain
MRHRTLSTDMVTKRFWNPGNGERRSVGRKAVDFYAVELSHGGRYLRKITNISRGGLLIEDRLRLHQPGQIMELELPRTDTAPIRIHAEVVRVTGAGQVALRALNGQRLYGLGGTVNL